MCLSQSTQQDELQKLSQQGQSALAAGDYAGAQQDYEKLKALQPAVAEIHVTLGVIYFKEAKFDAATAELRRALQLKPTLPRVNALLAMSLSEQGRYKEALPGLVKGFQQTSDTELRRMCGLRLERADTALGDDSKAIAVALELQRSYPDDPEVLYYASKIFGNSAYLAIQKLLAVAPSSSWRFLAAGEALESQGEIDGAVANYREVLKRDPTRPNLHFRIGRALLSRGLARNDASDLDQAKTEFEQEIALDPGNANSAYELAEIYRKQNHDDDARRYYEQAVASYPGFEEAHVGLAAMLLLDSKPEQALAELQKAASLEPDDPVAWYRMAQADRALGKRDEQQKALEEFRRLHNRSAPAANTEVTPQQIDASETP